MPWPYGALTGERNAYTGTSLVPPDVRDALIPGGIDPNDIAAYRWDGDEFVEIPVQVDEVKPYCLSNINSDFGIYSGTDKEYSYAWDVESWKKTKGTCSAAYDIGDGPVPDPAAMLDDDDEIVFMASDAGDAAPVGAQFPPDTQSVQAVVLVDPLDAASGGAPSPRYVYLAVKPGGSSATDAYVSYVRDANADQWIDQGTFADNDPQKLGSSNTGYGPNIAGTVCDANGNIRNSTDRFPRDGVTVSTDSYQWYASGRWMIREMRVSSPSSPGDYGPDLIDRWKGRAFQQSPDSTISVVGFEDEQVNWEANSALLGERKGPVRAIREIWGADSGTNVTNTETFYRDVITYRYHVRVHPIPPDGLYTSWDYNAHTAVKYYNTLKPDGVDIDGVNDDVGQVDDVGGQPAFFDAPDPTFNIPSALLNWEQVSGAGDAGSLVYIIEMKGPTTLTNSAVVPYYRDDACLDDGTGDDPVQRPYPGESTTDSRVMAGYSAAAGGVPYASLTCEQKQGAWGAHGIHYFITHDTDNAFSPEPVDEIDAMQWQFAAPTSSPSNVGEAYGNNVRIPLQSIALEVVPLPALPSVTTTTMESPDITLPPLPTTTLEIPDITLPPLPTTTLPEIPGIPEIPALPDPAPPQAASTMATTSANHSVTILLSGADLSTCELEFATVDAPQHGSLGIITGQACSAATPNADTAQVTYAPAPGFYGNDSFTFVVNDGTSDSSPATVSITVTPPPPPCATGPRAGCRKSTKSGKGNISIDDSDDDVDDALSWKWSAGEETAKADFGRPDSTTDYELCVFDQAGNKVAMALYEGGEDCDGKPCWRSTKSGFGYKRNVADEDGDAKLTLKAGANGKAKIIAAAGGDLVDIEALPPTPPVLVQLRASNGACWEATYSAPARNSDQTSFEDKAD